MNREIGLKLELDISAQRIMSHLKVQNELLEDTIQKGIESAIKEFIEDSNFELLIKNKAKEEILAVVEKIIMPYEIKGKIEKAITAKIEDRITEYADKISEQLINSIK